ncbi:hypothetical protein BX666DRAFT_1881559 [Dichotomocladium elegans]|nr:hypothetical protein BX666DRAFT_1881559 [Dichotomocladium elegans]
MRFSIISVALCLVAGVLATPVPPSDGAQRGAASSGPAGLGSGNPLSAVTAALAGLPAKVGAPGKRGLLDGVGSGGCSDHDGSCNAPRPHHPPSPPLPPHEGGCSSRGDCPVGPSDPTDCIGILQSLLRELYPTLDFTAHELDIIVAQVLRILGADDLSYAFLHGRIGLLNDLLATLGCTIDQLVFTIEQVVSGIAH